MALDGVRDHTLIGEDLPERRREEEEEKEEGGEFQAGRCASFCCWYY